MGYRTVVMLNNDVSWYKDKDLAANIHTAACNTTSDYVGRRGVFHGGRVVEREHADTETLAVLKFYTEFNPVSHSSWSPITLEDEITLRLLRDAAKKLGYKVVKL